MRFVAAVSSPLPSPPPEESPRLGGQVAEESSWARCDVKAACASEATARARGWGLRGSWMWWRGLESHRAQATQGGVRKRPDQLFETRQALAQLFGGVLGQRAHRPMSVRPDVL